MTKLKFILLAFLASISFSQIAHAGTQPLTNYTASSFVAAQAQGRTIVVDVHADWCPTCRAQQPILNELRSDPRLENALFVRVNFDEDKAFLRAHRIPRQSTILVFKGREEEARSIAETNRSRLRAVILGAL